jgi:DNA polymerase III subunit delta
MASALTYEQLESAFRQRRFEPFYLFFGEERFLIDELQRILLENALQVHERDFNLDIVYGAEAEGTDVVSLCMGYPMMADRRVVIVRDFDKLKQNRLFQNYADQPNPAAVVVLVCSGKPNFSQHPYRALRKAGTVVEFKPLTEARLGSWIQQRVKDLGFTIEPQAVQMLTDFVGRDLRRATSEIEKLITYAGDRKKLTLDDVIRASGQTREFNVFELQKAVGAGNYRSSVRIMNRMLQHASNPKGEALMIVTVLASYFVKLWKLAGCRQRGVSEREMASEAGISPFFVKEYLAGLATFSQSALADAFASLMAADYELKGGSTRDDQLVLALLLRSLAPAGQSAPRGGLRTGIAVS